jgi:hypothetical protein
MQHAVDGLIGQLGGGLDVGAVEGSEGQGAEVRVRGGVAQVIRQPLGQ